MNPKVREALEALLDYEQADADGVMVLASREAIHVIADALAVLDDGWIPVSERLPKEDDYVLVYEDRVIDTEIYPFGERVTHWRELPPPPQEDKSDG